MKGFIKDNIKFIDLPITEVYNLKNDMGENKNIADHSNVKRLKNGLVKLKKKLKGKYKIERSKRIDVEARNKLKSLGYLSGKPPSKKNPFTKELDLKTMLPLQNRMLKAIGKYQNGDLHESIPELREIVKENPGFILVYGHIATILKESGQVKKAVEILESGLRKNPGNPGLLSKLGIMLAEVNRVDEAVEILEKCISNEKNDPENFNYLGVAYYKKGDFRSALENYQKALELDNNYASVFNNIGSLYLVIYLKKKDERAYQMAIQNFSRAIEIDPRLFAAYNGRGAAYKFKNKIEKAIEDWKRAIEIKPGFIDSYFNIGISYLEKGDKDSALKYFLLCKEKFNSKLPQRERQRLARLIDEAKR